MKVVFSHPTGNANVRSAVNGFYENQILGKFAVSLASFPGTFLDKMSSIGPLSEIKRRQFDPALQAYTDSMPWLEAGRLLATRMQFRKLIKHETGKFSIDSVYNGHDKWVAGNLKGYNRSGMDAVYAYEDAAVNSFTTAKALGMHCFYDLPIGYWRSSRELLEVEKERWPEWAKTLTGLIDSDEKLAKKDKELELADKIYVASSFTASTLKNYRGKNLSVEVIPYGFPPVNESQLTGKYDGKVLKLLFVGGLSQRKGIADLVKAVEKFGKNVHLTIVGNKTVENCEALDVALAKHHWIPSLPHDKILELMSQSDVLVFPSLFEGFGLVITEAMSQGTPVITTERTAGPDFIENNKNGWIVNAGSTAALEEQIEKILLAPALLKDVSKEAIETARKRPWSVYSNELAKSVGLYR